MPIKIREAAAPGEGRLAPALPVEIDLVEQYRRECPEGDRRLPKAGPLPAKALLGIRRGSGHPSQLRGEEPRGSNSRSRHRAETKTHPALQVDLEARGVSRPPRRYGTVIDAGSPSTSAASWPAL